MGRQLVDHYEEDSVAADASDAWQSAVVIEGKTVHLSKFGAAAADKAIILLQVRTETAPNVWETLRAIVGPGQFEFDVNRDFVGVPGDVTRFRVMRMEKSGAPQQILAWLEGYLVT